jgi:hypothetical protein
MLKSIGQQERELYTRFCAISSSLAKYFIAAKHVSKKSETRAFPSLAVFQTVKQKRQDAPGPLRYATCHRPLLLRYLYLFPSVSSGMRPL